MQENKTVLSVEDVAKALGLNRNTIYREVRSGRIPSVRVGDRFLIPKAAFEKWLECQPKTQEPAVTSS